jgi:hypothetical protein
MPTATGLPQRGDLLRDPVDNVWKVIKRFGNSVETYTLLLTPMSELSPEDERIRRRWQLYGDPEGSMRLLEAGYWIGHGWRLLPENKPAPVTVHCIFDTDHTVVKDTPEEAHDAMERHYDHHHRVELDRLTAGPRQDGWYGLACFNGLSEEQQERLVNHGNLPIGYIPEGWCKNPAEVEITTRFDEKPGPRFYCLQCAPLYLAGVWKERHG